MSKVRRWLADASFLVIVAVLAISEGVFGRKLALVWTASTAASFRAIAGAEPKR